MTKTLTALAAAAVVAVAAVAAPTTADARNGGAVAAGVIGGLAVGAIVGSSAANSGYYGYGYAPAPVYYGPPAYGCYITRQRVWTNYGPRWQRVRVCD